MIQKVKQWPAHVWAWLIHLKNRTINALAWNTMLIVMFAFDMNSMRQNQHATLLQGAINAFTTCLVALFGYGLIFWLDRLSERRPKTLNRFDALLLAELFLLFLLEMVVYAFILHLS